MGLVEYNEDAQWWLEGPDHVEQAFKSKGFPCVSPMYVHELEDGL